MLKPSGLSLLCAWLYGTTIPEEKRILHHKSSRVGALGSNDGVQLLFVTPCHAFHSTATWSTRCCIFCHLWIRVPHIQYYSIIHENIQSGVLLSPSQTHKAGLLRRFWGRGGATIESRRRSCGMSHWEATFRTTAARFQKYMTRGGAFLDVQVDSISFRRIQFSVAVV